MKKDMLPMEVSDLHFSYGNKEVLKGISGTFYSGTFYGIAGPNGSGKTTLLKLMAGLHDTANASIRLFGEKTNTMNTMTLAKQLSFVPQMFNIPYAFSVYDVVMMGRYPYVKRMASPSEKDHKMVEDTLVETNLYALRDRKVNELSGGELQRVIIARAIVQETDIILLDEPISHLDVHYQHDIIHLLKSLCRDKNMTVIAVLHDLNITINHCDHVFLMKEGNIIAEGEPMSVMSTSVIKEVYNLDVRIVEDGGQKLIAW